MIYLLFKRLFDFLVSLFVFILVTPIIIIIALLLLIFNKTNPFFTQDRPGKNEKVFKIIKFRSMNNKRGIDGNLLPDNERLTKVGRLIRKFSLDEIPQLINVIKGDMSLVGPRPLRVHYLPLYNEEQKKRHRVKPGITGWAQVNGRNNISWTKKFEYDVWYVENISFGLDLKIIFLTILKVIKSKDIAKEGYETTVPFNGQN